MEGYSQFCGENNKRFRELENQYCQNQSLAFGRTCWGWV